MLLGLRALHRHGDRNLSDKGKGRETDDAALDAMAREVVDECKFFPGTLAAVGKVIEAVLSNEIVKAKCVMYLSYSSCDGDLTCLLTNIRQRLKSSLDIATASQDNHLRAVIIALTSAHYVHTASDHAKMMLDTARQLAAGMGAPSVKYEVTQKQYKTQEAPELGNAPLGLWVGERFQGTSTMLN